MYLTLNDVIGYLNELLEIDRPAIAALIANRTVCNEELANHPTVQASAQHGGYHVGMFGIINGMFNTDVHGYGPIMAVWKDGYLVKFIRTDSLC